MRDIQNLESFYSNPLGRGNTSLLRFDLTQDDLRKKYEKLKEMKGIELKDVYITLTGDYYFHFLIKSMSDRNVFYDTILMFYDDTKEFKTDKSIKKYKVKYFSNCPSFTFTFANVYHREGLLIEAFVNKYSKIILKKDPVVRNSYDLTLYDKSVFFAMEFMLKDNRDLFMKDRLSIIGKRFNFPAFVSSIRKSDDILTEVRKEDERLKKIRKDNKKKEDELKKSIDRKISATINANNKNHGGVGRVQSTVGTVNKIKPKKPLGKSGKKR